MNTLADWLAHCERLHPKTIELTLDRVAAVKARLDLAFDPATALVVVGGTNGKGSTCAMLEAILDPTHALERHLDLGRVHPLAVSEPFGERGRKRHRSKVKTPRQSLLNATNARAMESLRSR